MHRAENSFLENPRKCGAISDGNITDAEAALTRAPVISVEHFRFDVRVEDGRLPERGSAVVFFFDLATVPMSPMSVTGVHRHLRRRPIRRHDQGASRKRHDAPG